MINLVWHPVVRLPLDQDLTPFLQHLDQLQILHHVTEEGGQQQLWITDETRRLEVANMLTKWLAGDVQFQHELTPGRGGELNRKKRDLNLFHVGINLLNLLPVTLGMILLGLLGTIAVFADTQNLSYAQPFLFQSIENGGFLSLSETLAAGQYWRLFTPVFLHFSLLHIVFNSVILWEFGRRIELAKGTLHILIVVLVVGLISNFSQYVMLPDTVFGGLSGVVYGVIGYIAVYQHYIQHSILQFNKAAIAFFIIWLLLGVFGIIDFFISGSIANAAHVAGLITGAIIGLVEVSRDKTKTNH